MSNVTTAPKLWRAALVAVTALGLHGAVAFAAPINVLTVDCTPFVAPGFTSFGPDNTMGMALQQVDPGALLFSVTEVTPAAFRAMTAAQLAAFDLIAVNNQRNRIDCDGTGLGLGTTWQGVVGISSGGRVVLSSHDAPRFHSIVPPFGTPKSGQCPSCEPFGSENLVRDAALWAGNGCQTGLLVFNDAWSFDPHPSGGQGWDNPELNFPALWGISDIAEPSAIYDGGYIQILGPFLGHPIYLNVTDARLAPNSISSFAANIGDASYHSAFATHNAGIFSVTETVINSGIPDPGAFGCCSSIPVSIPNATPLTLLRNDDCPVQTQSSTWGRAKSIYR
jgi:hypothetical protein